MTQHGTTNAYVGPMKCRCNECREALRVYQAKRNKARHAYTAEYGLPSSVEHGYSAYVNWGCRCEICTTESTLRNKPYQAAYRERQKEMAKENTQQEATK